MRDDFHMALDLLFSQIYNFRFSQKSIQKHQPHHSRAKFPFFYGCRAFRVFVSVFLVQTGEFSASSAAQVPLPFNLPHKKIQ